jgi:lysine 6-dehydrogenase
MRILVLGAGLQGSSCAFDLLQNASVKQVRLADHHHAHLPAFLAPYSGTRLIPTQLDVRDRDAVAALMKEADAVACALPYYLNLEITRLAVEHGVHYCDLGGNTEIVLEQKKLHDAALAKSISIIPDCGLAPGMVNILAQHGIGQLDSVASVRMFVGGLPKKPEPPLNYQIVYSIEGMLDYYTTESWILRDARRAQIEALSEIEEVKFPAPLNSLEAFHTAGGLSTMALRYEGKIPVMEYKTLRYPGHAQIMKAIRDLSLLDTAPVEVDGLRVSPRKVFIAAAGPHLRKPAGRDLVALRVMVAGKKGASDRTITYELIDRHDEKNGVTAMMRTTGYSLAITALMQVRGDIVTKGVHTPDESVPGDEFIGELALRDINIAVQSS